LFVSVNCDGSLKSDCKYSQSTSNSKTASLAKVSSPINDTSELSVFVTTISLGIQLECEFLCTTLFNCSGIAALSKISVFGDVSLSITKGQLSAWHSTKNVVFP